MQKTILVTGATSGIGLAAAKELARLGHRVFATGRNVDALRALNAESIETIALDVTSAEDVERAFDEVQARTDGRGVDVLVNCAGYATAGPVLEMEDDALRAQFDTNVFGLVAVTKRFAEPMLQRRAGRIVNVGSVSGRISAPLLGAYHATKYALEAINDAMRMELHAFGVDVVLVDPGTIKTEFAGRTVAEALARRDTQTRYAPAYANMERVEHQFQALAAPTKHTTRAIVTAALSNRPCARYVAPRRFWAVVIAFQLVPTWIYDALVRWSFGLTRAKLLSGQTTYK